MVWENYSSKTTKWGCVWHVYLHIHEIEIQKNWESNYSSTQGKKPGNFYTKSILVEIKVSNWLVLKCISWMSRTSGVKLEKSSTYISPAGREANVIFQKLVIGGCRPLFWDLSLNPSFSLSPSVLTLTNIREYPLCARHYPHGRILSMLLWWLILTCISAIPHRKKSKTMTYIFVKFMC